MFALGYKNAFYCRHIIWNLLVPFPVLQLPLGYKNCAKVSESWFFVELFVVADKNKITERDVDSDIKRG